MSEDTYYTFEETLEVLGVTEDDLKHLVVTGGLPAVRTDNKMLFRREDVEAYKMSRDSAFRAEP